MILSFGAILSFAYQKQSPEVLKLAIAASLIFFIFEFCFRVFHWAPKIRRVHDLALYLQGQQPSDFKLYDLNNEKYKTKGENVSISGKWFDLLFYMIFLGGSLLLIGCPKLWLPR